MKVLAGKWIYWWQ